MNSSKDGHELEFIVMNSSKDGHELEIYGHEFCSG